MIPIDISHAITISNLFSRIPSGHLQSESHQPRSQQIRGCIDRKTDDAVEEHHRIETSLKLPVRLPPMHKPDKEHDRRTNQEPVGDPIVRRVAAKKNLRTQDAPDDRGRVVVPRLQRIPCRGRHLSSQLGALVTQDESCCQVSFLRTSRENLINSRIIPKLIKGPTNVPQTCPQNISRSGIFM